MEPQSNPGPGPEGGQPQPTSEFDQAAAARKAQLEQAGLGDLAPKHAGPPVNTAELEEAERAKGPAQPRHAGADADLPPSLRVVPPAADQHPPAGPELPQQRDAA